MSKITTANKKPQNYNELVELRVNELFDSSKTKDINDLFTKIQSVVKGEKAKLSETERDEFFILSLKLNKLLIVLEHMAS
jgi:ribosomal protein L4